MNGNLRRTHFLFSLDTLDHLNNKGGGHKSLKMALTNQKH
jgi:hypothetical protein